MIPPKLFFTINISNSIPKKQELINVYLKPKCMSMDMLFLLIDLVFFRIEIRKGEMLLEVRCHEDNRKIHKKVLGHV